MKTDITSFLHRSNMFIAGTIAIFFVIIILGLLLG